MIHMVECVKTVVGNALMDINLLEDLTNEEWMGLGGIDGDTVWTYVVQSGAAGK